MESVFITIFYLCSIYEGQKNSIIVREECHEYFAKCLKDLVINSDYSIATCIENKKKDQ